MSKFGWWKTLFRKDDEHRDPSSDEKYTAERRYVLPSLGHEYEDEDPNEIEHVNWRDGKELERKKGDVARQYAIASIANLMMLSFGIASGWPSTALPQLTNPENTPLPVEPLSTTHATWLAPLYAITGIPLAPIFVMLCERWGRKPLGAITATCHLLANLVAAVGVSTGAATGSQTTAIVALYISRALSGFATASGFMFAPLYCREISDNKTRGPLGVLLAVNTNVGTLCAYVFGGYSSFVLSCWLYTIPPILFLIAFYWLPETPVYLLRKGREEEATKALLLLRGEHYDVEGELEEMKESLERMKANRGGGICTNIKELFSSAAARKAILIVVVLMFNKEFSGNFCITSYTSHIFQQAGTTLSPGLSSVIVGVMLVLGTIVAAFLCPLLGRKILLVLSNVIMSVSLFGLGMYFYLQYIGKDLHVVGWAPVTFMSIYVVAYNIGLGPLPLVLLTELFTPKLVSTAMIFIGPIPGILAFLSGKFIYDVAKAIGLHSCFWGFAGICVLGIFFIIFVIPETKNRPLDEIQTLLVGDTKEENLTQDEDNVENEMTEIPLTSGARTPTPLMTDF